MKSQYLILMALDALLVVFGSVNAAEKELQKNQVPKADLPPIQGQSALWLLPLQKL